MDSFSDQLRAEAQPIWREIFAHPFLKGIKDGTLPLETFQYYLGQDYLYLEGFARCVALALAKSPNAGILEEMAKRVMTPIERPLHHKLLEAAGLTLDDAKAAVPSPHQRRLRQPHARRRQPRGPRPHRSGHAPLPLDLPPAPRGARPVRTPPLRTVDQLLCLRPARGQRQRLVQLRRPPGPARLPRGARVHATGLPDQQPLRVDVLGRRLPPGNLARLAKLEQQRPFPIQRT